MRKTAAAAVADSGLRVTGAGAVVTLTLDRPDAGNRITQRLAQALCDAAATIELDDAVTLVVINATGPHFCLGIDGGGEWEQRADWIDAIARLTRPVVAVIQGDACAEGLELALACDLRVVSDRAHFSMPQLNQGRFPRHGGTQRLPRTIGRMRALDLLLTGRTVGAAEAAAIGLASRLAPHAAIRRTADSLIEELTGKGPIALRYAKEAVIKGSDLTLDQGIRLEEDLYVLLQTTRDRAEGIRAFLSKRKPVFRGH